MPAIIPGKSQEMFTNARNPFYCKASQKRVPCEMNMNSNAECSSAAARDLHCSATWMLSQGSCRRSNDIHSSFYITDGLSTFMKHVKEEIKRGI